MHWNDVARNWATFSAPILQRWPYIEEDALTKIDGDYSLFVAELAKIDGGSVEAAQEQIDIWLASGIPADVLMDELAKRSPLATQPHHLQNEDVAAKTDLAFGDEPIPRKSVGRG